MNGQFGKIPFRPVDAGAVAAMSPAGAKVYLVLTAHSRNWEASLSLKRMADLAGISVRSVIRAVQHLERIGTIKRTKGNGRGRISSYRINGDMGDTVYQRKRVTRTSPNTREKW